MQNYAILYNMKTILKAICDYAFYAQGNKLSIIGIFENVNVLDFPSKHPSMSFVLALEGEPNKRIDYYFSIENPSGKIVIDKSNQKAQAEIGANGKLNLIYNVVGVPIEEEGIYKINLFAGDLRDSLEFNARPLPKGRA